ncbi:sensor histidine kinase [Pandoraea sp. E26]|uniref:sensor histidine kinase n=1 Tax=Pandoraea sp. E26 TaxID=1427365 RepID=UPI000490D6AF|nr:HAMP domain-containing sensor histidine kinase [Pandoraea sp. E26]
MLENVSYRYKIPLALAAAIFLTECAVTAVLLGLALADARHNVVDGARSLTNATAIAVRESLVRDDLFRVYEFVRTPVAAKQPDDPLTAVVVFDANGKVYAGSEPRQYVTLTKSDDMGHAISSAIAALRASPLDFYFQYPGIFSHDAIVGARAVLAEDNTPLGFVVATYDTGTLRGSLGTLFIRIAVLNAAGFLLLIPLSWLWGARIARPLHRLSNALGRVHTTEPEVLKDEVVAHGRDEIGRLSASFRDMLDELAEKRQLEREMVVSERLAAVGRVAAGIAHEINNPLGGLINAVDTLGKHGQPDGLTQRTLALLERGLAQIRATVGALLFEARLDSPTTAPSDWDDLRLLVQPQVLTKRVALQWHVPTESVNVPSHLVRQLVLNLLLNAMKAVPVNGRVSCRAAVKASTLRIEIANTGEQIPEEMVTSLFEPYWPSQSPKGVRSYGIGLWVSYQIVTQLGGTIAVLSDASDTTFEVILPLRNGEPS